MEMRRVFLLCKLSLFSRQDTEWWRERTDRVTLDEDGESEGLIYSSFLSRGAGVWREPVACSLIGH